MNGEKPDKVPWFGDLDYWATALVANGKKPKNFQKDAILWRLGRNRYLGSFDPGLGKTFINICVFSYHYIKKNIDSVEDFEDIVESKKGDAILLKVQDQDGNTSFVGLEIPN